MCQVHSRAEGRWRRSKSPKVKCHRTGDSGEPRYRDIAEIDEVNAPLCYVYISISPLQQWSRKNKRWNQVFEACSHGDDGCIRENALAGAGKMGGQTVARQRERSSLEKGSQGKNSLKASSKRSESGKQLLVSDYWEGTSFRKGPELDEGEEEEEEKALEGLDWLISPCDNDIHMDGEIKPRGETRSSIQTVAVRPVSPFLPLG